MNEELKEIICFPCEFKGHGLCDKCTVPEEMIKKIQQLFLASLLTQEDMAKVNYEIDREGNNDCLSWEEIVSGKDNDSDEHDIFEEYMKVAKALHAEQSRRIKGK